MWTSNIINRSPDDPPLVPLISLTRPSPAHCTPFSSIFSPCVSMPWCAIWLLAAFPGLELTSLYHDSIWTRAAVGEGTIGDHFSNKWSRLLRFWNFRSTVVCFVWKAAFGPAPEEFYHFCDHQLIKTDEIVGHRESWMPLAGNSSRRLLRCWDVAASTRISSFVLINNDLLDWGNDMKWDSFLQQLTLWNWYFIAIPL